MIIRGILDYSLSRQLCIRGFAKIKDLAKTSRADYSYQRELIDKRKDIINFLEKETHLFFPEIILGYKIKHSFFGKKSETPPLQKLQPAQTATSARSRKYTSNVDGTTLKTKTIRFQDPSDSRSFSMATIVEMTIDDSEKVFHRIDGNHRLDAAEQASSDKIDSMFVPFCIILGEEFYENGKIKKESSTKEFDKNLKVYFHNINTKTVPLTSEENLKVIIDDESSFSDDEVLSILGREGLLTRLFLKKYNTNHWDDFFIKNSIRTIIKRIFELSLENEEIINVENSDLITKVFKALHYTINLVDNNYYLNNNSNIWLFKALVYYKVTANKQKIDQFICWISQNRLYAVKEIITTSVISIFDSIYSKNIEIFVAMPFWDENQVKSHSAIYSTVVEDIKKQHGINIMLHKPMTHKGATFDLVGDIFEKIKNCKIFIANITDNNPNVTYEMGWARALEIPTIIVREEKSTPPKSDYRNDWYSTYEKDSLYPTLSKEIHKHIIAILNSHYGFAIPTAEE